MRCCYIEDAAAYIHAYVYVYAVYAYYMQKSYCLPCIYTVYMYYVSCFTVKTSGYSIYEGMREASKEYEGTYV